jgi:FkbM family methyltransferase
MNGPRFVARITGTLATQRIQKVLKQSLFKLAKPIAERFPVIAFTYRTIRDNQRIFEHPKITPMGFKFNGNKSMEAGLFEISETEVTKRLLSDVDVVINVGANIGYYCCLAAKEGKHVVAFEPMPQNLRYLLRNIQANDWAESIEVFPLALSNKVGVTEIYGGGTAASLLKGWAGNSEKTKALVPLSTLDVVLGKRFLGQRVLFIIDIEGAEKSMLEGANTYLKSESSPIWLVEIAGAEHQPKGVKINPNLLSTFELFWDNGYVSHAADETFTEITRLDVEKVVATEVDSLKTHNFLFFKHGSRSATPEIPSITTNGSNWLSPQPSFEK